MNDALSFVFKPLPSNILVQCRSFYPKMKKLVELHEFVEQTILLLLHLALQWQMIVYQQYRTTKVKQSVLMEKSVQVVQAINTKSKRVVFKLRNKINIIERLKICLI